MDDAISGEEFENAPVLTADDGEEGTAKIVSLGASNGVPASKLPWRHSRNWTVMGEGSVLPSVDEARRLYLAESHLSISLDSDQAVLDLHPSAEPVEVETLLNCHPVLYLDNEDFSAGWVRWDLAGGDADLLPIGSGVVLHIDAHVTQSLVLPAPAGANVVLQVTCATNSDELMISWQTEDTSGALLVDDPSPDFLTYSIEIPTLGKRELHITLMSNTGDVTLTRVQLHDPLRASKAQTEAARRHRQAAEKAEGYSFTFPMDEVLTLYCGTLVRVQAYRYRLGS